MWSDNETTDDLLGFQVHADLVRSVVTDPKMLPVTIGVFGDWGGGKTSIMKMLERDLDPEHWAEGSPERLNYERKAGCSKRFSGLNGGFNGGRRQLSSKIVDGERVYNDELTASSWALNSAVECHPHTVEVIGSNPIAPTIKFVAA
jgi:hypothetical protein